MLNAELEDRVRDRTSQLEFANSQLSQQLAATCDTAQLKLQSVLDAATQVAIILTDVEGTIQIFNSGAEKMLQYHAGEMVGLHTPEIFYDRAEYEERASILSDQLGRRIEGVDIFVQYACQGKLDERDWTFVRKDGSRLDVSLAVTPVSDREGRPDGFLMIAKDITIRKSLARELLLKMEALGEKTRHAELANIAKSDFLNNDITELRRTSEALRISEATSRSLFENASQGILTADREGRIIDANAMAQKQFGYSRAEMVGEPVEMLLPEGFRKRHIGHRAGYASQPRARLMGHGMDLVASRKDGSEFPVEISLSFVAEHQSGGLAMAFISDITARKQANQERERLIAKLEGALAEKTVLLKEVHHRVKNNLAVIAGLLGMQADAVEDERLTMALEKSQQRVASMALVHEYLYSTEHLDRVNFGKYVQQLAHELCTSYLISDLVGIEIEAEEIDLPVHRAIPCGLILNELLSNALKYGFPGGRSGKITVRFARLETGELSLSCQDDGVGVPESFDWQHSRSLGLKIVQILTKQLDGELTLDRSGGTRFELRFLAAGIA
jgi:PAS domain S-box-containing protein